MLPSPKSHAQLAIVPSPSVDVSVKSTVRSVADHVYEAVGAWFGAVGDTLCEAGAAELAPSSSVTLKVTV